MKLVKPSYVHCALTGMYVEGTETRIYESWCGRQVGGEFTFMDASHAALNARHGGYLLLCPKCSTAIKEALAKGAWDGSLVEEEADDEEGAEEHPQEHDGDWGAVPAQDEMWRHPIHGLGKVVSVNASGIEVAYETLTVVVVYPTAEHFVHQGHKRVKEA
jgi:hypothetical protein